MGDQRQSNSALAAAGLKDISQEFADEIKRKPSSEELFGILTGALNSMSDDSLSDVNMTDIIALRPEIEMQPDSKPPAGDSASAVDQLNDTTFVVATDVLLQLIQAIETESGQLPTLNTLLDLLLEGLHRGGNILIDISSADIKTIRPELRK